MQEKLTQRRIVAALTGACFAIYAVYNVFIIVRDRPKGMPASDIIISAIVALVFAALAGFMWTFEIKKFRFGLIRRAAFIIALLVLFLLKLRQAVRVITMLDFSDRLTVLYGGTYLFTLVALLILLGYYVVIIKNLPYFPLASVLMPLAAAVLFLGSFVLEIILFFGFRFGYETTMLRTAIIRPVFYLGCIGLSVYFLFQPKLVQMTVSNADFVMPDEDDYIFPEGLEPPPADNVEFIDPADEDDYILPEGTEPPPPDAFELVDPIDEEDYLPPEDIELPPVDAVELVDPIDDEDYLPPEGIEPPPVDAVELVDPIDDEEYLPPEGIELPPVDAVELVDPFDEDDYLPPGGFALTPADSVDFVDPDEDELELLSLDNGYLPIDAVDLVTSEEEPDDMDQWSR